MPEPTLEQLIEKAIAVLTEMVNKRLKAKQLRDAQKQHSQAKNVSGYGELSESNPSDSTVDEWTDQQCDDFANACKSRSQELAEPEGPGVPQ